MPWHSTTKCDPWLPFGGVLCNPNTWSDQFNWMSGNGEKLKSQARAPFRVWVQVSLLTSVSLLPEPSLLTVWGTVLAPQDDYENKMEQYRKTNIGEARQVFWSRLLWKLRPRELETNHPKSYSPPLTRLMAQLSTLPRQTPDLLSS